MTDPQAAASEPFLEVRLFGFPEVRVGGSPLPPLHSRRGLWLLALLALRAGRPIDRLQLAGLLWPDSPDATALHNLRQALADVRRALGTATLCLQAESRSLLALDVSAAYIDVLAFDAAVQEGTDSALERAAALYRGPVLDGCDEPWAADSRAGRAEAYLTVLERLAGGRAAAGDHAGSARWLRLAIAADPYRESAHRALMRALATVGERAAATQIYRELRTRLHDELNAQPDKETSALFREIRERANSVVSHAAHIAAPALHIRRLPTARTELIGRDAAVQEIAGLFGRTRIVTLAGSGGVGKSRLALQVAADAEAHFDDGVAFIPLAALSEPERVPEATRQGLGIVDTDGRRETVDLLIEALANRRLLLVFDSCEHLLMACARLVDTLVESCPTLHILTTSRQPLSVPGESVWRVPGLTVPPAAIERSDGAGSVGEPRTTVLHASAAVQLFVARAWDAAGRWSPGEAELEAIGEVCRRLDGIPLAIELAAARTRSLSAGQIAERLTDRFHLLKGGSRTAPNRHQTLRAAIDWSYDLLDEAERTPFRRLSLFAGGWTLESAGVVCGLAACDGERWNTLDLLDRLVEKSLVVLERSGAESRYSFLETIRQYAWERLAESGEQAEMEKRHAEHCVSIAEEAMLKMQGPASAEWLERLEAEYENMRRALAWLLQDPCAGEAGLRLSSALCAYFLQRGRWNEGREVYAAVLAHPGAKEATLFRAQAANCAGILSMQQSDYEAARSLFEEAIAIRRQRGEWRAIAGPLHNLGELARIRGDFDQAQRLAEEALSMNRESGNRVWEAHNQRGLGNIACDLGDFEAAKRYLDQSVSLFRELGNNEGVTMVLMLKAVADMRLGNLAAARSEIDEALALGRLAKNSGLVAHVLVTLSMLLCMTDELREARACMTECFQLCQESRDPRVEAYGLETMARLAYKADQPARAARLCGAAQALREQIGSPLPPSERPRYEQEVADARAALGDEAAFNTAWQEGRALTIQQAIELALGGA